MVSSKQEVVLWSSQKRFVCVCVCVALVSYQAMGLPWTPLSYEVLARNSDMWDMRVLLPWISAVFVAALILNRHLRRPGVWRTLVSGAAFAAITAIVFAFLFVFTERVLQGGQEFLHALLGALHALWVGAIVFVCSAHVAIPLGCGSVLAFRKWVFRESA